MIGETEWFRRLEGKYHYMGESHGAGDVVRPIWERPWGDWPFLGWMGLWARSPLPGHQAGRAARVSAICQAGDE